MSTTTQTKTYTVTPLVRQRIADMVTPVNVYLRIRDHFPNSILLESSDYHGNDNSYSIICLDVIGGFEVNQGTVICNYPDGSEEIKELEVFQEVPALLHAFTQSFQETAATEPAGINGFFGYTAYDAIQYFETIRLTNPPNPKHSIPEIKYNLYRYLIVFNHFKNELFMIENQIDGESAGGLDRLESIIFNSNIATFPFKTTSEKASNVTDEEYVEMVLKGKQHCYRGDVFQIVLSRQFYQSFEGDEFNVYRGLRSINPSPYLFYFDYGGFKIFGSSPEAQLIVKDRQAVINPIAGTFKRTGNDEADKQLAIELLNDPKENAEHVMLVDLARNDLSRNANKVEVATYKEVQYYSHVIHLVSKVIGALKDQATTMGVMADSFPAGTLSGAPKYRAMELIDEYENQNRGYYGGCIGFIGFNADFNQAIMIRSFLSKNNTLFCQAGAGIVADSDEHKELQEVNNKLAALMRALELAAKIGG